MPNTYSIFAGIEDAELCSEAYAKKADEKDELSKLRKEFIIPKTGDLKNKKFGFQQGASQEEAAKPIEDGDEESIYFCGNSLGLQPRRTKEYVNRYLDTWASKGVFGHFTDYEGGLPPWLHIDEAIKEQTGKIVGALPSEVVIMETLTANLHLLMSSFYRPTKDRWKIIIEGKAFPSDHVGHINVYSDPSTTDMYHSMQLSRKSPTTTWTHRHSSLSSHHQHQRPTSPTSTSYQSFRNTPQPPLSFSYQASNSTPVNSSTSS
jgi:kynureninase